MRVARLLLLLAAPSSRWQSENCRPYRRRRETVVLLAAPTTLPAAAIYHPITLWNVGRHWNSPTIMTSVRRETTVAVLSAGAAAPRSGAKQINRHHPADHDRHDENAFLWQRLRQQRLHWHKRWLIPIRSTSMIVVTSSWRYWNIYFTLIDRHGFTAPRFRLLTPCAVHNNKKTIFWWLFLPV